MSSLGSLIRELAPDGLQINIWLTADGRYQANVKERAAKGWTCHAEADAAVALTEALRQRAAGVASREVISDDEMQIDLEEAIAAAPAPADDFSELL